MAFVIYKKRHKGKLAETLSRRRALLLKKAMQYPERLSAKDKKYIDNIKQLSIPPAGRLKPMDSTLPEKIYEVLPPPKNYVPSGKDRAAGDS